MHTLLAILSFPFWFVGLFLMILGVWGTFSQNGVLFEPGFFGRLATSTIGIGFWLIAYMMVTF